MVTSTRHYWLIGEPATTRWAVVAATQQSTPDDGPDDARLFIVTCTTSPAGRDACLTPAATRLLRLIARQDPDIASAYRDVLRLLAPDLLTPTRADAVARLHAALTSSDLLRLTVEFPRLLRSWGNLGLGTIAFFDVGEACSADQRIIEALIRAPTDSVQLMICTSTDEDLPAGLRHALTERATCCDLRPQEANTRL